ncbi:MAG: TfuA-like protein [Betaproteobacteria bacterium]
MKPIVFLGPSLLHADAAAILDSEIRAPAAAGDVLAAALRRPPAIVLVDGFFERVPAVWHKEILFAIESGVPVYGASSMGALRAVELHSFGMIGVGWVFERYRSGDIEDDDEVAVVHAPAELGYRAISDAMVNIRDGLAAAVGEGVIDRIEHDVLVATAKHLFYPERVWPRVASESGLDDARMKQLLAWIERVRPNIKRDDAIAVLERVRDDLHAGVVPKSPSFELERSIFWEQLVQTMAGDESVVPSDTVTAWAKLRGPPEVARAAILRHVVRTDARRRGLSPDVQALQSAFDEFCRHRGLMEPQRLAEWLRAAELDMETLIRLVGEGVLIDGLVSLESRGVDVAFVDELKLAGQWAELTQQAMAQGRAASDIGVPSPTPADAGVDTTALLAWYSARFRPMTDELSAHARSLGFPTATDLMVAMTRAYLAERS